MYGMTCTVKMNGCTVSGTHYFLATSMPLTNESQIPRASIARSPVHFPIEKACTGDLAIDARGIQRYSFYMPLTKLIHHDGHHNTMQPISLHEVVQEISPPYLLEYENHMMLQQTVVNNIMIDE